MNYQEFLLAKVPTFQPQGLDVSLEALKPQSFGDRHQFQPHIARWALKLGRAAIFAKYGMGKTVMQLTWANQVCEATNGRVLILAPLAVAKQTEQEAVRFGFDAKYARSPKDCGDSDIVITNYEMLSEFDTNEFAGVVLDESSILKNYTGKTKTELCDRFAQTQFKLCCSATPAPNDYLELGNHAEFLGVMTSHEMISRWFINDLSKAGKYHLKAHGAKDFWTWVASWAVCMTMPSDLGFSDDGWQLPALNLHYHSIAVDHSQTWDKTDRNGQAALIRTANTSAVSIHAEMRLNTDQMAAKVAELVAQHPSESWVLWCFTDYESKALKAAIPQAIELKGSEAVKRKEEKLTGFTTGEIQILITKPKIAGLGLNWQHCHHQAFMMGSSYSFELFHQALHRLYRFGQLHPVETHLIFPETAGAVWQAIAAKQEQHELMQAELREAIKTIQLEQQTALRMTMDVQERIATGDGWTLHLGDCVEVVSGMESNAIDFTIFSPPFSNLYTYSPSLRDMGNTLDDGHFFEHFDYLIPELLRVTVPGRLCAVHCKDLPLYMGRDGAAGLRDFPGEVVRRFVNAGWTFHSRVTIWKCPQTEMERTNNHGLLHSQLCKDSSVSRQGMADYMLVFRKWSEEMESMNSVKPVCRPDSPYRFSDHEFIGTNSPTFNAKLDPRGYSIDVWRRYASPVWFDIQQTNVLNVAAARESRDEKHMCPLQLDVIDRCIELWTNPGDLVLSPFAGIGSEGYVAIQSDRRFVGVELKESYWRQATKNLEQAEALTQRTQLSLFAS